MHILVSTGTANAQTHALGKELKKHRLPASLIQSYSTEYTLPSKLGKVSKEWTAPARFDGKEFSSFASHILTIVSIIGAFLVDHVRPLGIMAPHIECWLLLVDILGLLTCGGAQAVEYMDLLVELTHTHTPRASLGTISAYDKANMAPHFVLAETIPADEDDHLVLRG